MILPSIQYPAGVILFFFCFFFIVVFSFKLIFYAFFLSFNLFYFLFPSPSHHLIISICIIVFQRFQSSVRIRFCVFCLFVCWVINFDLVCSSAPDGILISFSLSISLREYFKIIEIFFLHLLSFICSFFPDSVNGKFSLLLLVCVCVFM